MILGITCRSYTGVTPQFRFPGRHCNLSLSELAAFRKNQLGMFNRFLCNKSFNSQASTISWRSFVTVI